VTAGCGYGLSTALRSLRGSARTPARWCATEGLFIGYRSYDKAQQDVAFPFGFGLSYTSFVVSDLTVTMKGSVAENTLAATVTVTVTNSGTGDGAEVVQVCVQDVG